MAYSELFLFLQSYCLQAEAKKNKPPKMKVPVEIGYLQKRQNDYERREWSRVISPGASRAYYFCCAHTFLSSTANLNKYV